MNASDTARNTGNRAFGLMKMAESATAVHRLVTIVVRRTGAMDETARRRGHRPGPDQQRRLRSRRGRLGLLGEQLVEELAGGRQTAGLARISDVAIRRLSRA